MALTALVLALGVALGQLAAPEPAEPAWAHLRANEWAEGLSDDWLAVIWCESRGDPQARGAAGEYGLTQIMPQWVTGWGSSPPFLTGEHPASTGEMIVGDPASLYDPGANVRAARAIRAAYGWGPWVCARRLGLA